MIRKYLRAGTMPYVAPSDHTKVSRTLYVPERIPRKTKSGELMFRDPHTGETVVVRQRLESVGPKTATKELTRIADRTHRPRAEYQAKKERDAKAAQETAGALGAFAGRLLPSTIAGALLDKNKSFVGSMIEGNDGVFGNDNVWQQAGNFAFDIFGPSLLTRAIRGVGSGVNYLARMGLPRFGYAPTTRYYFRPGYLGGNGTPITRTPVAVPTASETSAVEASTPIVEASAPIAETSGTSVVSAPVAEASAPTTEVSRISSPHLLEPTTVGPSGVAFILRDQLGRNVSDWSTYLAAMEKARDLALLYGLLVNLADNIRNARFLNTNAEVLEALRAYNAAHPEAPIYAITNDGWYIPRRALAEAGPEAQAALEAFRNRVQPVVQSEPVAQSVQPVSTRSQIAADLLESLRSPEVQQLITPPSTLEAPPIVVSDTPSSITVNGSPQNVRVIDPEAQTMLDPYAIGYLVNLQLGMSPSSEELIDKLRLVGLSPTDNEFTLLYNTRPEMRAALERWNAEHPDLPLHVVNERGIVSLPREIPEDMARILEAIRARNAGGVTVNGTSPEEVAAAMLQNSSIITDPIADEVTIAGPPSLMEHGTRSVEDVQNWGRYTPEEIADAIRLYGERAVALKLRASHTGAHGDFLLSDDPKHIVANVLLVRNNRLRGQNELVDIRHDNPKGRSGVFVNTHDGDLSGSSYPLFLALLRSNTLGVIPLSGSNLMVETNNLSGPSMFDAFLAISPRVLQYVNARTIKPAYHLSLDKDNNIITTFKDTPIFENNPDFLNLFDYEVLNQGGDGFNLGSILMKGKDTGEIEGILPAVDTDEYLFKSFLNPLKKVNRLFGTNFPMPVIGDATWHPHWLLSLKYKEPKTVMVPRQDLISYKQGGQLKVNNTTIK